MKKIYTLIVAALVCSVPGKAQFTMLQRYFEPSAATNNNKADMVRYDSINALNNSMGQAQTWDFSAMEIESEINTLSYTLPNSQTADSVFGSATLKGSSTNATHYFRSDTVSKTFELIGSMMGGTPVTYSDPKTLLKFDISYGSTFNDNYTYSDGITTGAGSYSVNASGSGDLKLVGGKVFPKTLQLTALDHMTITTATDTSMVTEKTYLYYYELNRYPLLKVVYHTEITDTVMNTATIWVNWLEAVGLTENNFFANYAIYPNPATTHFSVKLTNEGSKPAEISIYRITGELVKRIDLGSSADINTTVEVGDLAKGIYLVTTKAGHKAGTRKLVIE